MKAINSVLGGGAALMALLGGGVATAQDGVTTEEEIIVTAQRRAESVQDVPFSVTAVGGEEIEQLGANGFETFANRVAGLQAVQASPSNTQFFMRGVSSGALTFDQIQQSSTVGIYYGDISTDVSGSNPNFQLFDIDRIEVLRGPQGTLYGAGSMSGAVRIVPTRPGLDEFGVGFGTTVSQTANGGMNTVVDATVDVPIVPDQFGVRLMAYSTNYDGVVDNVTSGEEDADSWQAEGGRISVRAVPSPRMTVDLMVAHQNSEQDGTNRTNETLDDFETGAFFSSSDQDTLGELSVAYDFGPVTFTSVTGLLQKSQDFYSDLTQLPGLFLGAPGLPVIFPTSVEAETLSQEVRLQSNSSGRFQWILGAYYSALDRNLLQTMDIPGIEAVLGFPAGPFFGTITDRVLLTDFQTNNDQFAVFGQIDVDVTDRLSVSVGGRYFEATQDSFYDDRGLFIGGSFQEGIDSSESGFNPRVNIAFEIDEDHNLYAQAARGFRLGGPNYFIPPSLCAGDLAALGYPGQPPGFESDSLWNYEIGSKNSFANGRGVFNVAAYYIDWSDIQSTVRMGCGYNFQQNLGSARVQGLEAEFALQVTDHLSVRSSVTFTDSELQDAVPLLGVLGGERAPQTPEQAASIAIDYARPLGSGEGFVSADVQYVGDRTTGVTILDSFDLEAYTLANLRLGYNQNNWSAYVFANNLFDERAVLDRGTDGLSSVPGSTVTYARPRTIGLTVRRSF
jgi:outer membrane receptor protein involved in Fe transport